MPAVSELKIKKTLLLREVMRVAGTPDLLGVCFHRTCLHSDRVVDAPVVADRVFWWRHMSRLVFLRS